MSMEVSQTCLTTRFPCAASSGQYWMFEQLTTLIFWGHAFYLIVSHLPTTLPALFAFLESAAVPDLG